MIVAFSRTGTVDLLVYFNKYLTCFAAELQRFSHTVMTLQIIRGHIHNTSFIFFVKLQMVPKS